MGAVPSKRVPSRCPGTFTAGKIGAFAVTPLAVKCAAVGGSALSALCPGVVDANGIAGDGLNNIGLLVTIAGKVTFKSGQYISIDDGSNVADVSGRVGVLVKCPSSTIPVEVGDIAAVAGIIEGSVPSGWTANRRYIHVRDMSEITKYGVAP